MRTNIIDVLSILLYNDSQGLESKILGKFIRNDRTNKRLKEASKDYGK